MTLQDAVGHAVRLTDVDQRQYVWYGLMVTGDVTARVKGKLLPFFVFLRLSLSRGIEASPRRCKPISPRLF
jgi:hypothetical protein